MPDYGRDMSGAVDIDPTLQDIEGLPLMGQVCVRRLYTPNQSLLSSPGEQTCDVRDFCSKDYPLRPDGSFNLDVPIGTITAALKADPRIFQVSVKPEWFPESSYMTVGITGVGSEGPFELTLGINKATVKVLLQ